MPHQAFKGHVPADRRYCAQTDMWVMLQGENVLIGATSFGLHLAGHVIAFTSKPGGALVQRSKGMATIECHKTVLAVHAPVSFELVSGNGTAEEQPALINETPYGDGWMALGTPTDWAVEASLLCDAETYKRHIRSIDPEAQLDD